MRLIQNINKDIKETKAELYRLQAKLERLEEEKTAALYELAEAE